MATATMLPLIAEVASYAGVIYYIPEGARNMAIIWFVAQTDPEQAVLLAMSYAMMWSTILLLYALCYGRGWWKWTETSTWVTIAVGPTLGLWSLVLWTGTSIFVRMFDPIEADPSENAW